MPKPYPPGELVRASHVKRKPHGLRFWKAAKSVQVDSFDIVRCPNGFVRLS